jgi:nitroreductase
VGTPPMFPDARDYLEAHLVGFEGDLYDEQLTLLFLERLRTQQTYGSLDELKAAIGQDVAASLQIGGFSADPEDEPDPYEAPFSDELADGSPVVSDPEALEAAEQAASHSAPVYFDDIATGEWRAVVGPLDFYGSLAAGPRAFMITSPLEVAGIPFVWDPYPPDQRPQGLPGAGAYDQPFTLLVPAGSFDEAQALTQAAVAADVAGDPEDQDDYIDDPAALEAAEQAVRLADRPARALSPEPLDGWLTIVRDVSYDKPRLGAIEYALSAAGIPAEWKPFSPTEAPLLKLFALRETKFALRVPSEHAEAARLLLAEVDERTAEGGR